FARSGSNSTDIVLFYFKGGEAVNEQGHFFQKPGSKPEPGSLTVSALAARFAETPGAHVLLFDVDRLPDGEAARAQDNRDEVARWENFHGAEKNHVAVLRYAWLREAPRDTGLLKGLESVMPQASKLIDVSRGLELFADALI